VKISRKPLVSVLAAVAIIGASPISVVARDALAISKVSASVRQFDPARGEKTVVRFSVNLPSRIELNWYDARDLLVRKISSEGDVQGESTLTWDGRDEAGRVVPSEAYHYTVVSRTRAGEVQEFDLTDRTGGADVPLIDARFDSHRTGVQYVVRNWSRVNIRIGMREGGPLLHSLENWRVRAPGEHLAKWDGFDATGVMNIAKSEGLELWGMSFELPDNTVFVGDTNALSTVIDPLPWGTIPRIRKASQPKRMYSHAQQAYAQRGDFAVTLVPHAVVFRHAPIEIQIPEAVAVRLAQQRFEIVYFIDGLFVGENEIGALPATWNVDVTKLTPGDHLLSVNVRGYEGSFGFGSHKLTVPAGERGTPQ
jgi:hypothetical protein